MAILPINKSAMKVAFNASMKQEAMCVRLVAFMALPPLLHLGLDLQTP